MGCETDWPGTGAMLQGIGALIAAFAAVGTAGAAIRALTTWRSEVVGRRKVELAEEVLANAYEAADTISGARSAIGFAHEGQSLKIPHDAAPEAIADAQSLWATGERLAARPELWARLEGLRFRARPYFGDDAANAIQEIQRVRKEIIVASAMLARNALRRGRGISDGMKEKLENKIWDHDEPDDHLRKALDGSIATLERTCGAAIEAKAARRGAN